MGGPKIPPPSANELALQGEQLQLTRLQRQQTERMLQLQNLMEPYILRQMGFRPTYQDGRITAVEEIPREEIDPLYPQRQEAERLLLERSLAGLRGELPVSPGLLTDLARQEETLRETLRRGLGEGYELSTPGARRLEEFQLRRNQLLEEARRGDITLGEQLQLARSLGNMQFQSARFANVVAPYNLVGGYGSTFGAQAGQLASHGLQYYLGGREAAMRASAASSQQLMSGAMAGAKAAGTLLSFLFPPAGAVVAPTIMAGSFLPIG